MEVTSGPAIIGFNLGGDRNSKGEERSGMKYVMGCLGIVLYKLKFRQFKQRNKYKMVGI